MRYFYKLLLSFFLFPLLLSAQSNFRPGYVVMSKGDTLKGFIKYSKGESTPKSINFKTIVTNKESSKLTVDDISSFNVNKLESYQRYTGLISTNPTNINNMIKDGRDSSFKTGTIFLKQLLKGKNLALYSNTDDLKTRFFLGEAPYYTPYELIYRVYYDLDYVYNGHGRTVNENIFLEKLFALAIKFNVLDDDLNKAFETAVYRKSDLIEIINKINK